MLKKINGTVVLCILLAFCMCLPIFAENSSCHWYCKRNTEHKQPALDQNMAFIEQYGGFYVDRKHGDNCPEKVIYLTFDAGYENGNIAKILDVLKEENVPSAFFVLGNLIERNPDLIQRMTREGHLVCNHSDSHKDMTKFSSKEELSQELKRLEDRYFKLTGEKMAPYYRPPEGTFDERTLKYAHELGYRTIFWSFAYADWDNAKQPDPHLAKEKILSNIHNGAVILLHPTSETNALILKDVISVLKQGGYRFGTLDELTAPSPQPR